MVDRYSALAFGATQVEIQKLMYFLQEAGEPLNLRSTAHRYGPYADNLRHVLKAVEGHYLRGCGDGSASVHTAEPIKVLPGAALEATDMLAEGAITKRVQRVLTLSRDTSRPTGWSYSLPCTGSPPTATRTALMQLPNGCRHGVAASSGCSPENTSNPLGTDSTKRAGSVPPWFSLDASFAELVTPPSGSCLVLGGESVVRQTYSWLNCSTLSPAWRNMLLNVPTRTSL